MQAARGRDVVEVRVADVRARVPREHGVDGLGELGAARAVDAAGVDPEPLVAVRLGEPAALADLGRRAREQGVLR